MRHQSPESEVLLLCASQRPTESCAARVVELCRGEGFRWQGLFQAAASHQIAPLVLTNLQKIGAVAERMPPAIAERWKNFKTRNVLAKKNQVRLIRQFVGFFARRSMRVMLVKGAALDAIVYEEPWYTQSSDADLLIDRPYLELAKADRAPLWAKLKGAAIELEFARHHDLDMNTVLDVDYRRVWADARPVPLGDVQAYGMSPEDMLLTACINLCRKRYQQLKGMMGIRELIRTYPLLDWEKLGANALACGANRIAYVALAVTGHVLGCELPGQATGVLRVGLARRWAIRNLSRSLSGCLFRVPRPAREPAAGLLTSHLLRVASYRVSQLGREMRALIDLRRFLAVHSKMTCAESG